jgi:hypothetical protein
MSKLAAWTDEKPPIRGWYAVMYGWDSDEGTFVNSRFWNGEKWDDLNNLPIFMWSPQPFDDFEAADKWAADNDPDL